MTDEGQQTIFSAAAAAWWPLGHLGLFPISHRVSRHIEKGGLAPLPRCRQPHTPGKSLVLQVMVARGRLWCLAGGDLRKNFMYHCTLQQTSLLIRSPRIRRGIWTVSSGVDRMMSSLPRPPCAKPHVRFLVYTFFFYLFIFTKGTRMATLEGAFGAIAPSSGRFAHCEPRHPPVGPLLGPFTIHRLPLFAVASFLRLRLVYALDAHPGPKHAIDFQL